MAGFSEDDFWQQLSGKPSDFKKASLGGESSPASRPEKLIPVRPAPPPPSGVKPGAHHSYPDLSPSYYQEQFTSLARTGFGQSLESDHHASDSERPSSRTEIHQPKERGRLSPVVIRQVKEMKDISLPLQNESKSTEKRSSSPSVLQPPKPAPRHSLDNILGGEVTTLSSKLIASISPKRERASIDGSDVYAKINKGRSTPDSPDEKAKGSPSRREAMSNKKLEQLKIIINLESGGTGNHNQNAPQLIKLDDDSKGDKPALPLKPDLMKRHESMRSQDECEQLSFQKVIRRSSGAEYDNSHKRPMNLPTDSAQDKPYLAHAASIPPLKTEMSGDTPKPPLSPKRPAPSIPMKKSSLTQQKLTGSNGEITAQRSGPSLLSVDSIEESLLFMAAAPPKPPRTHAHDEYLRVKDVSQSAEAKPADMRAQSPVRRSHHMWDTHSRGAESQNKISSLIVADSFSKSYHQAGPTSPISQPLMMSSSRSSERISICQPPPTRPPPPKRRPNSGDRPITPTLPYTFSNSLEAGLPTSPVSPINFINLERHHSCPQGRESPSRHPFDKLPSEPSTDQSLQRIAHYRSSSSPHIHSNKINPFSISSVDGEEVIVAPIPRKRSSCLSHYEAVIDPDGYAIPSMVMRLPEKENNSFGDEGHHCVSPIKFLTRLHGSSDESISNSSENALGYGSTAIHDQSLIKVNKKTMIMVKQKINQAYADVNIAPRRNSENPECDWELVEHGEDTGELVVEPAVQRKRIEYCASVRRRSVKSISFNKEFQEAVYPQLFDYCMVVTLRQLVGEDGYEPCVMYKFPENYHQFAVVSTNFSVPSFCFPDAMIFRPGTSTSLSEPYSFVMTCSDGSHVYGYCRRIQPPDSSLPEVFCIVSPVDAFNMYNTLLDEIENRRRISYDLACEMIAASFGRPLPKLGKVCHIRTLDKRGDMETIFLNRSTDTKMENVNYESPLHCLGTDKLVMVFSSMLMERRIILSSSNLSVLTQTIHALSALLYPFHWQHVYIPLLPGEMLDAVCAPMPFVVGILSSFMPRVLQMDLEEVFIVDLDKKSIVESQGDEANILPRKLQKALKTAMNMPRMDSGDAHGAQWLIVVEAFLRMFVETIGHFLNHICTQQDGNKIFQKEGFILEVMSKEGREFLEWFTETQMFEVFIVNYINKPDSGMSDLFFQRLKEYRESKEESGKHKSLGAKVKNFGKALKTKLQSS